MAKKIMFVPFKEPVNDISTTPVPKELEVIKVTGRIKQSALQLPGQQGPMGSLEFGMLIVADPKGPKELHRYTLLGPDMEVPSGAKLLPGEIPLPNGIPLYGFELPPILQ